MAGHDPADVHFLARLLKVGSRVRVLAGCGEGANRQGAYGAQGGGDLVRERHAQEVGVLVRGEILKWKNSDRGKRRSGFGLRRRRGFESPSQPADESDSEEGGKSPNPPLTRRWFSNRGDDASTGTRASIATRARQVGAHFRGVLVADLAVFLQRLLDDAFEVGGHLWIQTRWSGRGGMKDGIKDGAGGFTSEWQSSGRHLVEQDAEGK